MAVSDTNAVNWTNLTDNGRITGSLSNVLTITNAQASDEGNYRVIVTNVYGAVTSSVATLTVIVPPLITQQPTNQTVIQGNSATFIVSAVDGLLSHQWQVSLHECSEWDESDGQ